MKEKCPDCKGCGECEWPKPVRRPGQPSTVTVKCPKCNGSGKVEVKSYTDEESK